MATVWSRLHRRRQATPIAAAHWRGIRRCVGCITLALAAHALLAHTALAAGPAVQPSAPLTTTATAWHPDTADAVAFLPVVNETMGGLACDTVVRVQNVGGDFAKAVLVAWGEPGLCPPQCKGPVKVECSGLLKPGSTWNFLGAQMPAEALSAAVYSFTARNLSEIAPDLVPPDDIVADYMCETLFFGIVGDCDDYRRFASAFTRGHEFAGIPQDRAAGGPLAVWVSRDCPAGAETTDHSGTYVAPGGSQLGGFYATERTFRYIVPAGASSPANPIPRALYVQNAGLECVTVSVSAIVDCGRTLACPGMKLAPGERRVLRHTDCDLDGGAIIEADGPLAAVLDDAGTGNLAALPAEAEQRWSYLDAAVAERQAGGQELSAPLVYRDFQGWSTGFVVQNLSRTTEAQVRVLILDRSGDIISSYQPPRICPLGTLRIAPGEVLDMPGNFVGSVRIVNVDWWLPGAGVTDPPRLAGWAGAATATGGGDADAYPLIGRPRFEDWPPGAEQVGLVAVPSLAKTAKDGGLTSELAIANVVQKPGFTDFAVYIYDQNGMLDYICQKLNEKQVEYINLQSWGYVNSGFNGSAVISATFWEHDVFDQAGRFLRNDVGIEAVTALRPARKDPPPPLEPPPQPVMGDKPSWAGVGVPFTLLDSRWFGASQLAQCPALGGPRPTPPKVGWTPTPAPTPVITATPTTPPPAPAYLPVLWNVRTGTESPPTPTPSPTPNVGAEAEGEGAPYLPPSPQVFVPVLDVTGEATPCRGQVHAMNVSPEPLVALMVLWDAEQLCDENCPSAVICSGLIRPGTRWTFAPPAGRSAALFSLRAGTLADIGVPDQGGRTIASAVCDTLNSAIRPCGGTDAYAELKRAYDSGSDYHGVPMAKAHGGDLAVQVDRACPASNTPDMTATSNYLGVAATDVGAPDPQDGRLWYSLPLIYSARAEFDSTVYVQNASSECTAVTVWGKAQDDCLRMRQCGAFTIPPGQMRAVSPYGCVGDSWQGAFYVASELPLALAVDLAGRDVLMTYNGEPLSVRSPTTLASEIAGSAVLYAPLTYSEYQGWDTGIQVQNSSREVNAKVKAYFLDRSGDIITTLVDWICPLGSQTFFLPVVHDMPGDWVGSVRIESQDWWTPGSQTVLPPRITGVVTLIKNDNSRRDHAIAAATYNLLAEADAYDWKTGRGAGGLESGVGLVALPYLAQPTDLGARTELAVTNAVPVPGFTHFTLALFDANGRVDDVCLHLGEKQVAYLDLARWGHFSPTFTGSALLSATYWNHDVFDSDDRFVRRVVGLTAAVAERSAGERGADAPGDELSISTGIALRGPGADRLLPILANTGCRVVTDDETMIWVEAPQPGAPMGEVFVPALRVGPDTTSCAATVTLQNIGTGGYGGLDTKAVVIAWGSANCPAGCAPVLGVVCTGLIKPGASWTIGPEAWPAGAAGATVFSLTPDAADRLCPSLTAAIGADCARPRAFVDAYRSGGAFDGVQLARSYGGGLAAEVVRDCPAVAAPDLPTHAAYRGASMADARRADTQHGSFRYSLPQIGNAYGLAKTVVHVQNAGAACTKATLTVAPADGSEDKWVCATATIAPGATASLDAETCRRDGWLVGAGIVEADQPLAIAVDTAAPYSLTAYTARAVNDSAGASTVAFAPLSFSEYQGWDTAIHIQNLHPDLEGRVKVVFQDRSGDIIDTVTDWLCRGCATVLQLDVLTDIPGNWVGSVRVESVDYPLPGGGRAGPVHIQAVARLVRGGDGGDRDTRTEAVAYSLLGPGFTPTDWLWPTGSPGGLMTADAGRLAVPNLYKGRSDAPEGSELAIANLVPVPGFTDFAIRLFDQNGLMDTVCQKLNERQVEYINLNTWGYITPGFRGSGVISAIFWDHELRDAAGQPIRNLVGLGAVLLQRPGTPLGKDAPGDELAASEAIPLRGGLTDMNLPPPKCPPPYPPTPTPAPSRPDGPAR